VRFKRVADFGLRPEEDEHATLGNNAQRRDQKNEDLQTFVFSATLSKDLQHNLKKRKYAGKKQATSTLGA